MGRRHRPPAAPLAALRRAAVLASLLLLGACGNRATETLTVEPFAGEQTLYVRADATLGGPYHEVRVLRTLTLAQDEGGDLLLRPRDVEVFGDLTTVGEAGSETQTGQSVGLERSAQAACQPHLTPFWASCRLTDPDRVEVGLLMPDGVLRAPGKAPADDAPSIDDAVPFLLGRVPDETLPLVAAHLEGAWAPDAVRKVDVRIDRGPVRPELVGRLVLRRLLGRDRTLHLDVDLRFGGLVAPWLAWRVAHRVSGTVDVATDGQLERGNLESRTRVTDDEEELGTARHRVRIRKTALTPEGDEAAALGRLLVLRAEDENAFDEAVLAQTAANARVLVQRVRPAADLEHISVFLTDKVDPGHWPSGRPDSSIGTPAAINVCGRWEDDVERLLGPARSGASTRAQGAATGDAAEAAPEPVWDTTSERFAWSWTSVGVITAGREVVSDLGALCHEYAHFASERFGYADLARVGFDWEAEDRSWVDVDGVLSLAILEEAQAVATSWCAVLDCDESLDQRMLLAWYLDQEPTSARELLFSDRVHSTAYGLSPAVLAARVEPDDDLEATIARTWETWSYCTKQVLFPRDDPAPSRLWPRALALKDHGAVGGTRLGALVLLHALDRRARGADEEQTLALVHALEDDVALRSEPGGLLWVSVWRDAAAAAHFFERIEDVPGAAIRQRGRHVTVRVGDVPRQRAWLLELLPEAAGAVPADRAREAARAAPKEPVVNEAPGG